MRSRAIGILVLGILASSAIGSTARAQVFVGPGGPVNLRPGYGYGFGYGTGMAYSSGYSSAPAVLPYSYYAVPASQPARIYVGPNVFPFYGEPYGHIYDRWSWPAMSNAPNGILARYYYPPLGF